jgi:hypothetical protein
MKKLIIAFVLLFTLTVPSMTEAKGFSGGHSSISHSSSFGSHSTSTRSGSTYRSGYKSPSSSVSRSNTYRSTQPSRRGGSFWSHAAAFGAGALFGGMFHPFGGSYFGHSYGFSFFGLLFDILIIFIIIKIVKSIFGRRRY